MDSLIFGKINSLRDRYSFNAIQSSSIEVKIVGSHSVFYFSILIKKEYVLDEDCDEVVIEIHSKNSASYDIDVSDSQGNIYYENRDVNDCLEINNSIEESYLITMEVLKNISNIS
ncbi:hypothetical protein R0L47_19180 [Pectobacterium polonicum]|uniref:Uncharacterized protein n=1 Tax=Pectobacterium polonicum TaxID=2485124 RepID=A0ABV1PBZ1_9GAMM|nr:hypothetical protein [Pectobacterium polonicum]MDC9822094.1 hypothetical protein [Pectobacterium polonicum]